MIRTIIYCIVVAFAASACSSIKRIASENRTSADEHSAINPSSQISKRVYKSSHSSTAVVAEQMGTFNPDLVTNGTIETSSWLQFKYAISMDVPIEALSNVALLNYMEEWYGTPYRYGGSSREGIDCSAFTVGLLSTVFKISVPRTVKEQYQDCQHIEKSELKEGDLVFFNMKGRISHVGVYLLNNKFVHAAVSSGVMISDLGEQYYSRKFAGAGRVKL